MDAASQPQTPKISPYVKIWLISLISLLASSFLLDRFDTFTVITPDHTRSLNASFLVAGLAAIANAIVGWRLAANGQLRGRVNFLSKFMASFGFLLIGFLAVLLVMMPVVDIIDARIDFPASQTKTFRGKLLISRAYIMSGKGRSWHIQTQPIWTDIEITQNDFGFMQSHRRRDDFGGKPNEIRSNGYFCASVMLQSAGEALRVIHAGRSVLPAGSIGICPDVNG